MRGTRSQFTSLHRLAARIAVAVFAGGLRNEAIVTSLLEMRKQRSREIESVVSVVLKLCPDEARKGLDCVCPRLCSLAHLWILARLFRRTAQF